MNGVRTEQRLAVNDGLSEVNCPLCGSNRHGLYVWAPSHYGPEKYRVTKCLECSMIFTNPQPVTYTKEVAERGVLSRHFTSLKLARHRRVASLVLSIVGATVPGRRVLDFGCGEGSFVMQAISEGWDAFGTDLNAGLVEAANRHWNFDRLSAGSLDDFVTSQPAPFDAIVTSQVFEHLQEPTSMASKLRELLKPGGVLYIDVPNANQLAEWKERGITLDPTAHWNHFTVATLTRLMAETGFTVIRSSGAPSLVNVFHRLGLNRDTVNALGRLSRRILPPIGTGVAVLGRKIGCVVAALPCLP